MGGTYTAIRTALERRRRIADVSSAPSANAASSTSATAPSSSISQASSCSPIRCSATASPTSAGPRRSMPAALRGVDAVLISHLHYDHLDMPSLQRLGREMPVVAPQGRRGADQAPGRRHERDRDARRRGDPDRRADGARRSRRARHRPAAVRRPSRAARLRDRGRRALGLLRGRYGRLRRRWRSSRRWMSRCSRSGAGGRRWGPATWIRTAQRRRPRCSGRASRSRSTGAPTTPSTSGLRGPPGFLETPPPLFEQAMREQLAGDGGAGAPAGRADDYLSCALGLLRPAQERLDPRVHRAVERLGADAVAEARAVEQLREIRPCPRELERDAPELELIEQVVEHRERGRVGVADHGGVDENGAGAADPPRRRGAASRRGSRTRWRRTARSRTGRGRARGSSRTRGAGRCCGTGSSRRRSPRRRTRPRTEIRGR